MAETKSNLMALLWTEYTSLCGPFESTEAACREFLGDSHVCKMCKVLPQLHVIGNVFAHYLSQRKLEQRGIVFTTLDVMRLVLVTGSDPAYVVNHLHHMHRFAPVFVSFHAEWRNYQKLVLQTSEDYPLIHLKNTENIVEMVVQCQHEMQSVGSNHNRLIVLLFRVHCALEDETLQPRLQWGKENDWVRGLSLVLERGGALCVLKQFYYDSIESDVVGKYIHFGVSVRTPGVVVYGASSVETCQTSSDRD